MLGGSILQQLWTVLWATRQNGERAAMPVSSHPDLLVSQVITAYLKHARHTLAASTYARWERDLTAFSDHMARVPVSQCIGHNLTSWVDDHPRWKSPATRATAIIAVRTCFSWAEGEGLIAISPFRRVKVPRATPRRSLTDSEFDRLLASQTSQHFKWVLKFIRYTGARNYEVAGLRWTEIDWEMRIAVQLSHKTRHTQRKPKPRIIVLEDDRAIEILKEVQAAKLHAEYVFANSRGRRWTGYALSGRMKRLKKKLGLPKDAYLYGARHSAANDWLRKGLGLKQVSELLGHSSTAITEQWYLERLPIDYLRAELRKILKPDQPPPNPAA